MINTPREVPASIAVGQEHSRTDPLADTATRAARAAWRCPNSVVFVLISLWRHSSEWRGSRSYLVGGLERDPAPVQKQTEHIEPADHKHNLS